MKKDGLSLLLLFAQGPLHEGACGDKEFLQKSQRFLEGDNLLRFELKEEIPLKLKTAWPQLETIAKKYNCHPLEYKVVEKYVLGGGHNKIARPDCAVMKARFIQTAAGGTLYAELKKSGPLITLKYLSPQTTGLKRGDTIYYHRGWLIGKKPPNQYTH